MSTGRFDHYGDPTAGRGECLPRDVPGADDHYATPGEILTQIGWYRADAVFCSLNLTPDQARIMGRVRLLSHTATTEEMVTEALEEWMEKRK